MMDIKLIRDNPDIIRQDLRKRGMQAILSLVDQAIEEDRMWRRFKSEMEELRHRQNLLTIEIGELRKSKVDIKNKLDEVKKISDQIKLLETKTSENYSALQKILMKLPNILHESVPVGKDENDSVVIRTWGSPRKFAFKAKDHIKLLTELELVDIERAAKISGARFYFLKGDALKLEQSIMRYALDVLTRKGFIPVGPPLMMRREAYEGVVDINDFGPVIYKIDGEDLFLIATSEHPLIAMHMDEILDGDSLPLRYCGFSPNFRVEAGAHGKDTKGIFRTHQFYKVEQIIFAKPEDSWALHEELIANAEELYKQLGLHYRIVNICTGDIGTVASKKYDLEAWLSAQEKFREMVSCSNVTDYQTRRLRIRYREKKGGETKLVHTLNSTAVTTRTLVAIIENYQQEDGSITVPKPLVPYMGGIEQIGKR
jgi:seryl-tRNA synthetase